jgi:hypothetical protein
MSNSPFTSSYTKNSMRGGGEPPTPPGVMDIRVKEGTGAPLGAAAAPLLVLLLLPPLLPLPGNAPPKFSGAPVRLPGLTKQRSSNSKIAFACVLPAASG